MFLLHSRLRKQSDFHFRLIQFYFKLIEFHLQLIDFDFGFGAVHFRFGGFHSRFGKNEFLRIKTSFLARFCGFIPLRLQYLKIRQKAQRKNSDIKPPGFNKG